MSYNGSGVWTANSVGLPVVTGTTISSTMFNAFTADVATGLSTAVCKDGQQTCTQRVPFAQGLSTFGVNLDGSAGSGQVGFIQSGTGAVVQTGQQKLRQTINVLDFMTNAQRTDVLAGTGSLDVADAVQAAVDSVSAAPYGRVILPSGVMKWESTITVPYGVEFEGQGTRATRVLHAVTGGVPALIVGDGAALQYGCAVRDFAIEFTGIANSIGVRAICLQGAEVSNIQVAGDGVEFTYTGFQVYASASASSFSSNFADNYAQHCHIGLDVVGGFATPSTSNIFYNFRAFGDRTNGDTTSIGARFADGAGFGSVFVAGNFENCGIGVKDGADTQAVTFDGTRFEGNGTDVARGASAVRNTIFGSGNIGTFSGPVNNNGYYYGQYCTGVRVWTGAGEDSTNVVLGETGENMTNAAQRNVMAGDSAGDALTTGDGNTFIGKGSGATVQTGAGNIAIGEDAGTAAGGVHTIAAGDNNTGVWGNSATANNYIQVAWTVICDARDKRDIVELDY